MYSSVTAPDFGLSIQGCTCPLQRTVTTVWKYLILIGLLGSQAICKAISMLTFVQELANHGSRRAIRLDTHCEMR